MRHPTLSRDGHDSLFAHVAVGFTLIKRLVVSALLTVNTGWAQEVLDGDFVLLNEWVPAAYPADALKENIGGTVLVRFVADATGKVTTARVLESPDGRLSEAALKAVKQWVVEPLKDEGRAVASGLDVKIEFDPKRAGELGGRNMPRPDELPFFSPMTSARPEETPDGDYPSIMSRMKLSGRVQFRGRVTEEGGVVLQGVKHATHPDFVAPAIDSLGRWKFIPAMQGDLAISAEVDGEVTFDAGASPDEVLAANRISLPDGSPLEHPLVVVEACDAPWPLDVLLAREMGTVTVEFTVAESGQVTAVDVIEATSGGFGPATVAAMERWVFSPPPKQMRLRRVVEFRQPKTVDEGAADPVGRLVALMQAGKINSAKGLDRKLSVVYPVMPRHPRSQAGVAGTGGRAELEFVIDREGRVRLPRVIVATHDDFGWAAATAVAQWTFNSPTRGGEPVDVKVRMPFDFPAPTE